MINWKDISCKTCKHKKKCKGKTSKRSQLCQQYLGLVEKKVEKDIHPHIMYWALMNKYSK